MLYTGKMEIKKGRKVTTPIGPKSRAPLTRAVDAAPLWASVAGYLGSLSSAPSSILSTGRIARGPCVLSEYGPAWLVKNGTENGEQSVCSGRGKTGRRRVLVENQVRDELPALGRREQHAYAGPSAKVDFWTGNQGGDQVPDLLHCLWVKGNPAFFDVDWETGDRDGGARVLVSTRIRRGSGHRLAHLSSSLWCPPTLAAFVVVFRVGDCEGRVSNKAMFRQRLILLLLAGVPVFAQFALSINQFYTSQWAGPHCPLGNGAAGPECGPGSTETSHPEKCAPPYEAGGGGACGLGEGGGRGGQRATPPPLPPHHRDADRRDRAGDPPPPALPPHAPDAARRGRSRGNSGFLAPLVFLALACDALSGCA